jgi:predicted Rossmann-fold nucleotide-binding protein
MNKVLVCGGRDYADYADVRDRLDWFHHQYGISVIIHGAAHGADALAQKWAVEREIPYYGVPAKWKAHGRKAGPLRNQEMLDTTKPDALVAFPGGRGTADMVKRAEDAGIKVWSRE